MSRRNANCLSSSLSNLNLSQVRFLEIYIAVRQTCTFLSDDPQHLNLIAFWLQYCQPLRTLSSIITLTSGLLHCIHTAADAAGVNQSSKGHDTSIILLRVPCGPYFGSITLSDRPFDHRKATAAGFGESLLPPKENQKTKVENEYIPTPDGICVLFFCGSWFPGTRKSWICSEPHGCCSEICGIVMGVLNTAVVFLLLATGERVLTEVRLCITYTAVSHGLALARLFIPEKLNLYLR
ncbi:hypothetical protein DH2020_012381 [Rehmannia glutinosa]|uniref:Uncharacterized protein n=1 Tax=Rehmannia glutinosa TaxID=99300 RepID=A0ABR0X2A2_REHGL